MVKSMNKKEVLSYKQSYHTTVKDLLKFIKDNKVPDDALIMVERVEDVYFEKHQFIQDAIAREKQLKSGSRQNKINIVVKNNPAWIDLSVGWYE